MTSLTILFNVFQRTKTKMTEQLKLVSTSKCFEGFQNVYSCWSKELQCETKFSAYIPPKATEQPVPVLYWLSGLTCTEQNFIIKSGFQRYASQQNLLVIGPDTSPRGCNIEGEDDSYDFGVGAGFYLDAKTEKFKKNYRMYSYVVKELPVIVEQNFNVIKGLKSITGHSMGGHGALICGLKNPGAYKSVTAFAPISNPINSAWGQKCLRGYIGDNQEEWKEWDATELVKKYQGPDLHLLIDQGSADEYMHYLIPENFVESCKQSKIPLEFHWRDGYDHSFFFVSTFLDNHFRLHAKILNENQ